MAEISFICEDFEEDDEETQQSETVEIPGPSGAWGGGLGKTITGKNKKNGKHKKSFKTEEIKQEFDNTIQSLATLIDDKPLAQNGYELAELEVNLNISTSGKVSIFSIFSGDISAGTGITLKIKKKGA